MRKETMSFEEFKTVIANQIAFMTNNANDLYIVDVDKDVLWNTYLDSFPPGTNEIFRERREYDCNCCKQFIRAIGNVVAVIDCKMHSIWDVDVPEPYTSVVAALSELVKNHKIKHKFLYPKNTVGTDHNYDEDLKRWDHFYCTLPERFVHKREDEIPTLQEAHRAPRAVMYRSLIEITLEAADIVIDLIKQGLARGTEHLHLVEKFIKHKTKFDALPVKKQPMYVWEIGDVLPIRNTLIGTLLTDISDGKPLDEAVFAFENKVDPTNYKRPRRVATSRQIKDAQKQLQDLGYIDSLPRRHATPADISINDVLFADKAFKTEDAFSELIKESDRLTEKQLEKMETVGITKFINDILPKVSAMDILVKNNHTSNFFSLLAPENPEAPSIFKWNSGFSWTYNGGLADSMVKQRVIKAGGKVDGVMRVSLAWENHDDLDLHVYEPQVGRGENHIWYYNQGTPQPSSGMLDIDANRHSARLVNNPVENIIWTDLSKMPTGVYTVTVMNYNKRSMDKKGFTVEFCFGDETWTINYDRALPNKQQVTVLEFQLKNGKINILTSLKSMPKSQKFWNVDTEVFHRVTSMMYSPNFWGDNAVGNKHYLFVLDKCQNPEPVRGFFNEFLKPELTPMRRVMEMLGDKMVAPYAEKQLSGVGFPCTQPNEVIVRVKGSFKRTLKINFKD